MRPWANADPPGADMDSTRESSQIAGQSALDLGAGFGPIK
jgi:hypothetical protein